MAIPATCTAKIRPSIHALNVDSGPPSAPKLKEMSEDEKLLKEAKKLPWEDRLSHKNWKVRNDANIDLAAVCDGITDPKDPRLREFGPFFRKAVADSNAPVQEKALDALIAFLKAADADAGRYAKEVCDAIVTKCLTGRPKTVEKAQISFMLWVELEAVEAFLDAMEKGIKNKVAKAVVPAIDVMFQALSEFGSKIVPPKRILKMLPELFDHQDQNVRASSKGLTLELCRWIGKDPVKSILFEKMRDTMKKELEAELGNVTGNAKPTRKIRLSGLMFVLAQLIHHRASDSSFVKRSAASMLSGKKPIAAAMYKIMKEHKNPKVLSEGLLWMVSAVDDFGTSHIKLKDLIDFCKDVGLQSSAAATRNATVKLIGVLHKFVGPDIKGFLSDVKPALLSTLDAEYEKNPHEASAVPKKVVKVTDATSSAVTGGMDGLPREDISEKITPTLLKGLESSDWKVRLESIESVTKILEEANKRILPAGTGDLFGALKGRLHDSNKNLIIATLSTISALATAMGQPVEKSSKGILSDVLKCLGDNKKNMRECTLSTLDAWLGAAHLDKMLPYVTAVLTDAKVGAEGRKDLFDWLSRQLAGLAEFPDAIQLLKPTASAMTDKSADVRKAAEACFNEILRVCGQETVSKNLRDIQGSALAIISERLKPYGAFQDNYDSNRSVSSSMTSKSSLKTAKPNGHGDRATRHGSRNAPSRAVPSKGSRQESVLSVQDINIQSQALISLKDSNKDDRERIIVRRFKFEELRIEQIQDLECLLNNRTRIESADHVGFLLDNYGTEISSQLKSLQIVASLTAERDGDTRKAALNTLAIGYKILAKEVVVASECIVITFVLNMVFLDISANNVGDDIWRYVGKLTEAQRSMLDDRFKWKAREMEKRKEGRPGEARAALRRSVRENVSDPAEQSGDLSRSMGIPTFNRENYGLPEIHTDRLPMPRAYSGILVTITVKLMRQAWLVFLPSSCEYNCRCVAGLHVQDNAERTSSFAVLINLLRPLDPSRWPSPASNESLAIRNQKFSDLVVKCLIKLTKVLQNTIYDVDLDRILQSIHVYLQELGMDEIRKRAGADDKPLRMVKTVLHELVKLRGTAIKGHLSMVPIDMQPQPIILAYIDLNLQTLAAARMLTPSGPVGQTHWSDSTANNAAPATHSADAQLKQELAAIFKKIGDKQTCSIGLYELYRITQLYPQVDIFAQLQNASEAFRTYIRDGLAQMEKNAAEGRTPSSVPLSTPPPATLNLSPRYGAVPPVNADSLNDPRNMNAGGEPPNFSLPPSFAEDDHRLVNAQKASYDPSGLQQSFDEPRNDRMPIGVSNGTLDAIRERMKSIQLAAGGVNPESRSRPLVQVNGNVSEGHGTMQGGILPMDEKALSGLQARMERLKSGSFDSM
ncbi:hypothetical protein SASPL_146436 [Salvia splendens]|uniref:TOG domain-containing protein n=1 Tax=Salvia splendens TaxID=180675 RepID=A0A8X8WD92_SALSN|nr:hypothetical protein SASPL_146436 [Salvia splendens]